MDDGAVGEHGHEVLGKVIEQDLPFGTVDRNCTVDSNDVSDNKSHPVSSSPPQIIFPRHSEHRMNFLISLVL